MADLKALIKKGEGISVEFKECRRTLNRDVYKTVCAFLNRHGGTLMLGVRDAGEVTGIDPDMIEGDVFRIVVRVPELGTIETKNEATNQVTNEVTPEVTPQVTPQVIRLLNVLKEGELNRGLLMERLELHDRKSFGKNYLQAALEQDLIEMTQPDSPKSPTQRYRLTNAGKHMLKSTQE